MMKPAQSWPDLRGGLQPRADVYSDLALLIGQIMYISRRPSSESRPGKCNGLRFMYRIL